MPKTHTLLSALFLLPLVLATGQTKTTLAPSIQIGDVDVTIGQEKAAVLAQITAKHYRATRIGDDADDADAWVVCPEDKDKRGDCGQVSFRNGKLAVASRDWAQMEHETFSSLFGLVSQLTKGKPVACTVETETRHMPRLEIKWVLVICGRRIMRIEEGEVNGKRFGPEIHEEVR